MITIDPKEKSIPEVHKMLLGGVSPRPIAFVSTISDDGTPNLAPYSFFNAFGANPPMIAFSPSRRGTDGSLKDTYNNLMANGECVVHIVNYDIAHKMNLTSADFPESVNEFEIAGFTPIESDLVKPFRVAESPFQMECKLFKMVELGGKSGSGNLAICEVIRFHVAEHILGESGFPDPHRLDSIARNGGNFYTRASGDAIFELPRPAFVNAIGYNSLPDIIKHSKVLSANNIAQLASLDTLPKIEDAQAYFSQFESKKFDNSAYETFYRIKDYKNMLLSLISSEADHLTETRYEQTVSVALDAGDIEFASNLIVFYKKLELLHNE